MYMIYIYEEIGNSVYWLGMHKKIQISHSLWPSFIVALRLLLISISLT